MNKLTTIEIAKDLGLNLRTIQKYCQTGFLPAKQSWKNDQKVHLIDENEYYEWKMTHFQGLKKGSINKYASLKRHITKPQIRVLMLEWLDWCAKGKLTGKAISKRTLEIYDYYFNLYLDTLGQHAPKPLISTDNFRTILTIIPIESYSTRRNIYDSIMSFTKFLIENDHFTESNRNDFKKLKPIRFLPPRKTSLTKHQLNLLIESLDSKNYYSSLDKVRAKAIIMTFAYSGLRSGELCKLRVYDINLLDRFINVRLGKGNKNRKVGITRELAQILNEYIEEKTKKFGHDLNDYFFVSRSGEAYTVSGIGKKIKVLANKVDLDVTTHGLRRTFASLYSASGKPLNHLRIALGHADLTTTQSYIMTSEAEVVEAMKGW